MFYNSLSAQAVKSKLSTGTEGGNLVVDHDVVMRGNNLTTSTASLSQSLSSLSTGESSIALGGATATFSEVTLMTNNRETNGNLINRISCESGFLGSFVHKN